MSRRNLILFIVVLTIIAVSAFVFFFFRQPTNQNGGEDTGTTSTNFLANFLSFGKSKNTTPTDNSSAPADISGYELPDETSSEARLKKISSFPVAGYGVFMKERFKDVVEPNPNLETTPLNNEGVSIPASPATEFMPAVRYVEKATGNIYQTFADKIDERKFSSTIVPIVHEAFLGNKGESVIMRYLKEDGKTIQTFIGTLSKEYPGADAAGTGEITGSFLPENISDISISPDALKAFYLLNIGENVAGIVLDLETKSKVQIFDSPFTEWLSSWSNKNSIMVTTKPGASVLGYAYTINSDKKPASAGWDFNKTLGGINGLTTLPSPDGKMVLYGNNNLSLSILNIETGYSTTLGVKTLPEKCVWSVASDALFCAVPASIDQGKYPDSWYQGEVSFVDEIWGIDVASGNTSMISNPTLENGEEMDAIKLSLDENQDYLFFVNKKDSYLWELQLK